MTCQVPLSPTFSGRLYSIGHSPSGTEKEHFFHRESPGRAKLIAAGLLGAADVLSLRGQAEDGLQRLPVRGLLRRAGRWLVLEGLGRSGAPPPLAKPGMPVQAKGWLRGWMRPGVNVKHGQTMRAAGCGPMSLPCHHLSKFLERPGYKPVTPPSVSSSYNETFDGGSARCQTVGTR
jgi:hypothetical protein